MKTKIHTEVENMHNEEIYTIEVIIHNEGKYIH